MSDSLDISPAFKPTIVGTKIAKRVLRFEGTGRAIVEFNKHKTKLDDYTYWFLLSCLWVSYTGWSELSLWRNLFSSGRSNRSISIMKPSELIAFNKLADSLTVYRAKRENESDCIAYTLSIDVAKQWALRRNVKVIHEYRVSKKCVLALFLRRNEEEIIVLNPNDAILTNTLTV